ncbi:MAG: hypothetical protein WCN81_04285, partial [Actinomycetes bacterium]
LNHSGVMFSVQGASAERAQLIEAHEFVRRRGIEMHILSCLSALIGSLSKMGEWDEALKQAADLLPKLEATEDIFGILDLRSMETLIYARRGDPAEASAFLGWVVEKGRESEIGWAKAQALLAASAVHVQFGDNDAALGLLAECFEASRATIALLEIVPEAVRTAIRGGSDELAARLAQQVESLLPASRLPLEQHVATTIHGLVRERSADLEAAAADFAAAAAGWNDFCMPYEEAQALLGRGRCLAALGRANQATEPLAAAREIFARLGARPALAETDELMQQATSA